MDAVELLVSQHREVEELFGEYDKLGDDAARKKEIVSTLVKRLLTHAHIEEEVFYPAAREALDGEDLVSEYLHEHGEAEELLSELYEMDPEDPGYDDKVETLKEEVLHHVEEEEDDMLPRVREALGDERLRALADEMQQAERQAPSRPSAGADVEDMSKDEVYERAQEMELPGRSQMKKDELADEVAKRESS